jgi:hypothetical protein
MGVFLVTFDLKDASESSYESIYAWAHQRGGYRYFPFKDGTWGRLPSTTVVIRLEANDNVAARDEFKVALEKAGYTLTHIAVADGRGSATLSTPLESWLVPNYAKQRVAVGV